MLDRHDRMTVRPKWRKRSTIVGRTHVVPAGRSFCAIGDSAHATARRAERLVVARRAHAPNGASDVLDHVDVAGTINVKALIGKASFVWFFHFTANLCHVTKQLNEPANLRPTSVVFWGSRPV